MLIVAADNVEVRNNTITGNDSTGIVTVSYGILMKAFNDPDYDPWTETIWIHDNTFSGNGANPAGFFLIAGQPTLEDVLWDGLVDPDKDNTDGSLSYCVSALGGTFRMINAAGGFENQVTDPTDYTCEHDPLPPVNP
jgi:pectate lyase